MNGAVMPPESRSRRFLKLAGMTSSVVSRFARDRFTSIFRSEEEAATARTETYLQTGKRIADTLGELKGAVMKVGQMVSVVNELLPPELSAALATLQKDAPPVDFEVIADQIERELGSPPELLFRRFDRDSFAAASIGQVHRATMDDGREVVVKVQYPGVDRSVDADLYQLKLTLRAMGLIKLKKKVVDELFDEVRDRLHEELDYTNEAENIRYFQTFHRERGDDHLIIPDVVGERTAQRVLTMIYEPGDPLTEVEELGYSQAQRDRIGQIMVDAFAAQLFELRAVHADPNPANFACRRDGTLVMYDFGCIKKLEPQIIEVYKDLARAFLDEDYARLDQKLIELGARDPEAPPVPAEVYRLGRQIFIPAFADEGPFDFGSSTIARQLMALAPKFRKHHDAFQPPVPVIFVNRMLGGHANNLRRLGARVALLPVMRSYI
jgi:predicted unusual protein kinase regulating ubiquinone biosynthesis (AarF/ABC1/UbiB family)